MTAFAIQTPARILFGRGEAAKAAGQWLRVLAIA